MTDGVKRNRGNIVSSNEKKRRTKTTASIIATMYCDHLQPTVSAIDPPEIRPRLSSVSQNLKQK
jgi:hypothetical protein